MKNKRHVIITGGAKGIGAACAELFIENSFNTVILDIDEDRGQQLSESLGTSCLFIPCDVTDAGMVRDSLRKAILDFGEIDVLVNNAGINPYGTLTETSYELWDKVMDVNLKSHFICAKESIPSMQRNGKGVVINIASVQAYVSQKNVAAYTTSKTALLGLTRSIAVDYSPSIRSVAICPGTVNTPMLQEALQESEDPGRVFRECAEMHLCGRVAAPEEIATLVHYVSGEQAGFITGQSIRIDGGLGIRVGGSKQ